MGNALILGLLALFTLLWVAFAASWVWGAYRLLFRRSASNTFKGAWAWGLTLITIGLLACFALLGIALPPLLQRTFEASSEVSVSTLAVGILATLGLSWLLSLNRYRALIEDHFSGD